MADNQFDWVPFYEELAQILLEKYKDNRFQLAQLIKKVFANIGMKMPTLAAENSTFDDVDPFTTFALFNKLQMSDTTRLKILKEIKELLNICADLPTSFDGIPTVFPTGACYYNFDEHGKTQKDDLWMFFEIALAYKNDQSEDNWVKFSELYNKVVQIPYNKYGKITMALYWIAPDFYLNLDSRNEWYIYETDKIPADIVSGLPAPKAGFPSVDYKIAMEKMSEYLHSDQSSVHDFTGLSYNAFVYSEEINNKKKKPEEDGLGSSQKRERQYWVFSPGEGACNFENDVKDGVMSVGWGSVGDLRQYHNREELRSAVRAFWGDETGSRKNDTLCLWQLANEVKPGDYVFAKKGRRKTIGYGIVESEYFYDKDFEPENNDAYRHRCKVKWIVTNADINIANPFATKTLTNITQYQDLVETLLDEFPDGHSGVEPVPPEKEIYNKEEFLKDVFLDDASYDSLKGLLLQKKNVILQGAPGVGKTFMAKRLAYSIMGEKDESRIKLIQFHQSYSYEDFVMGYRPTESGFKPHRGPFYNFCKEAEDDESRLYFFIIDEINRGNISKIFGEMFMLIESDKRGKQNSVTLTYENEKFSIPPNVYIIGMMNTADRSLAMIDYALRRRFSFFDVQPAFCSAKFKDEIEKVHSERLNKLVNKVVELNERIANDDSLGEGYRIGHSYFCNIPEDQVAQRLESIVEFDLIPLLKEYWFDNKEEINKWSAELRAAIK